MEANEEIHQKDFTFRNNQNQEIVIKFSIKNGKLSLMNKINEDILNKKIFSSIYSFDEIKEKNKFLFLSKNLNDVLVQLEILSKENKSSFKKESNKLTLTISTNMALAPEIIFELTEVDKIKVEEIKDYINNFINSDIKDDKNLAIILKENKEMKEKIGKLEHQIKLLNLNFGFLQDYYFERIKEWIGGDKEKIRFNLIFKLTEQDTNNDRYHKNCNVNAPVVFIFICDNDLLFGSYCPYYNTSEGKWINDSNAFLFSLNLDKKYPAKKAYENYHRGCGYHFKDIEYCYVYSKKGEFGKTGIYLDKLELDGNNNYFYVNHFLAYKVEKS